MITKIAFLLLWSFCVSASSQTNRFELAGTRWKFIGLLSATKGTLFACPKNYLLNFEPNNKLTGITNISYKGKYWVKNGNRIKVKAFISKGSLPGEGDAHEFECRVYYSKYLGMGGPFFIQDGQLKIVSNEYVTMIFEPIE